MDKVNAAGSAVRAATIADNNIKALIGVRLRVMKDRMAAGTTSVSMEDEVDWLRRMVDVIGD